MPIPLMTVELAISIVNGVIKLGGKVDKIVAEQESGGAELALPSFITTRRTPVARLLNVLSDLLKNNQILLAHDLSRIKEIVENGQRLNQSEVEAFILKYQPESLRLEVRNNNQFVEDQLRRLATDWDFSDGDIQRLALYVNSGRDLREGSLEWRLAMAVVDVFAEFALEQQQRLIHNDAGRKVLTAVLERFSDGDLEEEATTAKLLFARVVSATLNGLLDSREVWEADHEWIEALLGALADARAQDEVSDDFLLGLVQGRGYRALIVELLEEGENLRRHKDGKAYQKILAQMLNEAARQAVLSDNGFDKFVQTHWTDIARAGLRSFAKYGTNVFDDRNPVVQTVLLAAVRSLAKPGNRDFISSDSLIAVTEAAIAAVAAKPELLSSNPDWASTFYGAFASVVKDESLRNTLSVEGLESLLLRTAVATAEHPEFIIAKPGFAQEITGSILKKISEVESLHSGPLAATAVVGALEAIENNPTLLETCYAEIFADFAGHLASLVSNRSLSGLQAEGLATAAAAAIAENPRLFMNGEEMSWIQVAYSSFSDVLADQGLRQTFATKGLEAIVKRAMHTVSESPELLLSHRPVGQIILANILQKFAGTPDIRIERLATTAIDGVVAAMRDHPVLLKNQYAEVIGDLAGRLADRVRTGSISGLQAQDLIASLIKVIAADPSLLNNFPAHLTRVLVEEVLDKATTDRDHMEVFAGMPLIQIVESVLAVIAARGVALMDNASMESLTTTVGQVVDHGLTAASRELGRQLDLPSVPMVIVALVEAWARGEIRIVDSEDEAFKNVVTKLSTWAYSMRELPAPNIRA